MISKSMASSALAALFQATPWHPESGLKGISGSSGGPYIYQLLGGCLTPTYEFVSSSAGIMTFPVYIYICGKIKNVPNHQPANYGCLNHL